MIRHLHDIPFTGVWLLGLCVLWPGPQGPPRTCQSLIAQAWGCLGTGARQEAEAMKRSL